MRVYLDTAPVIYTIEQVPEFAFHVREYFSTGEYSFVVSDLTRLECRVKPLREQNNSLLVDYDLFFANVVSETILLSRDVIDRATAIRAQYNFKTVDAIHLSAAIMSNCKRFLTNDHRLDRFNDIAIDIVSRAS